MIRLILTSTHPIGAFTDMYSRSRSRASGAGQGLDAARRFQHRLQITPKLNTDGDGRVGETRRDTTRLRRIGADPYAPQKPGAHYGPPSSMASRSAAETSVNGTATIGAERSSTQRPAKPSASRRRNRPRHRGICGVLGFRCVVQYRRRGSSNRTWPRRGPGLAPSYSVHGLRDQCR